MSDEKETRDNKKTIKVTDRRMFTPDGELREDFQFLADAQTRPQPPGEPSRPAAPEPAAEAEPPASEALADDETEPGRASFFDLVSLLGENASIYIQQAAVPNGERQQNLELAQLHIDLLEVLKKKTEGRLGPRESAFLDDVLYRLRMAYTHHGGE